MTDGELSKHFLDIQKRGSEKYGHRWLEAMANVRHIMKDAGVDVRMHAPLVGDLAMALCKASRLDVLNVACAVLEISDERVMAEPVQSFDGSGTVRVGEAPATVGLDEWRTLYKMLDKGRRGPLVP